MCGVLFALTDVQCVACNVAALTAVHEKSGQDRKDAQEQPEEYLRLDPGLLSCSKGGEKVVHIFAQLGCGWWTEALAAILHCGTMQHEVKHKN